MELRLIFGPMLPVVLTALTLRHRSSCLTSNRPTDTSESGPDEDESLEVSRREVALFRLLIFFPSVAAFWMPCLWMASDFGFVQKTASIVINPEKISWLGPAALLALCLDSLIQDVRYRRLCGSKYPFPGEASFGSSRLAESTLHLVACCGLAIVWILQLQTWKVEFTPTQMTARTVFVQPARVHAYGEFRSVRLAPSFLNPRGQERRKPMLEIRFADGSRWSLRSAPAELTGTQAQSLAGFIAKHSGVEGEEVPSL